jgi:hypothetical protein
MQQNKPPPTRQEQEQKIKSFAKVLPHNVVVKCKYYPELSARGKLFLNQ